MVAVAIILGLGWLFNYATTLARNIVIASLYTTTLARNIVISSLYKPEAGAGAGAGDKAVVGDQAGAGDEAGKEEEHEGQDEVEEPEAGAGAGAGAADKAVAGAGYEAVPGAGGMFVAGDEAVNHEDVETFYDASEESGSPSKKLYTRKESTVPKRPMFYHEWP